jgi:flagellar FliL protein
MSAEVNEAPPAATTKSKSGLLMVAALAMNGILTAGVVAFVVLRPQAAAGQPAAHEAKAGHDEEKKEEPAEGGHEGKAEEAPAEGEHDTDAPGAGPMVHVDNLVLHLRNPEVDRYLRLALDVELRKTGDLTQFQTQLPRVRDAIITYLSDCTAEHLSGSDGLSKMKAELADRIGGVVGPKRVKGVYITDFVVQ